MYVPFGGMAGDCGEYKGAVVGVPVDGTGDVVSYVVPTKRMGGIWNPTGLPVDSAGNLWAVTGNTASQSTFDFGNAVLLMSPELSVLDYFVPTNWVALNKADLDISTTAPVLSGDGRVFIAGKNKAGYLLDAADLGQVSTGLATVSLGSAAFGTAIAQGSRVFVPCAGALVAVDILGDTMWVAWTVPGRTGSPIIAAGLVWSLGLEGMLKAVDPSTGIVTYSLADIEGADTVRHSLGSERAAVCGRRYRDTGTQSALARRLPELHLDPMVAPVVHQRDGAAGLGGLVQFVPHRVPRVRSAGRRRLLPRLRRGGWPAV